jgi:hypothetical protein
MVSNCLSAECSSAVGSCAPPRDSDLTLQPKAPVFIRWTKGHIVGIARNVREPRAFRPEYQVPLWHLQVLHVPAGRKGDVNISHPHVSRIAAESSRCFGRRS